MNWELYLVIGALALAILSALVDVRQQRIPNWLTYPGIVLGFVLRSIAFGWKGFLSALAGCAFAGGIVLLFYLMHAMGAGDVKLLAAIGSLVGPQQGAVVLLATAIAGGLLALLVVLLRRTVGETLRNLVSLVRFHAAAGLRTHPNLNLDNPSAARMPYGLAIAAGTLYAFLIMWRS